MMKICRLLRILLFFILLNNYSFAIADMPNIPAGFGQKISLLVLDANTAKIIYSYNPDTPRLVASNMKLVTTFIALKKLRSDFHWHTKIFYNGKIKNGVLNGNVYLVGGGDPTLDDKAMYEILSQLLRLGINQIKGEFVIDEHTFNSISTYSMLEADRYDSDTILPHALIIDGDLAKFTLHINNKINITNNLYQYYVINNLAIESNSKSCDNIYKKIQVDLQGHDVIFNGTLSRKCDNKELEYNMFSHEAYTSMVLTRALDDFGIKFSNFSYSNATVTPLDATLVYDHSSSSLEQVLYTMNHYSVNLIAEAITLSLGAYTTTNRNTYQQAIDVYNLFLKDNHLNNPLFKLENGAGLSRREYLSANNMAHLLWQVEHSPLQSDFQATLPTPGYEGTLENKFISFSNYLQCKTGTLNDVRSYSGYFYSKNGKKYIIVATVNMLNPQNGSNEAQIFDEFFSNILNALNG